MKKSKLVLLLSVLVLSSIIIGFRTNDLPIIPEKDKRMEWWREAKFGMFIHFGLTTVLGGEYGGKNINSEWIKEEAKIPNQEFDTLVKYFNPIKFNAEDWVIAAKDAGMKYIVITTKHHDGFCLFDSKYTDYDIMSSPFQRDIMKELAQACRKYNMKICWYYSIMDWHHDDYLPRRSWEENRNSDSANFQNYYRYLKNQLNELMTNYGDIGLIWFDGEWEKTWNHGYGFELYTYLLSLQPNIIINNRVDNARNGMAGMSTNKEAVGDYGTPEQEIPEIGYPGEDWESCMTMNDHWFYNKFDKNWKSPKMLIQDLIDITSKGGNFLLDVGPTPDGLFPKQSLERLKIFGLWMKVNKESIYGTKASPLSQISWGRCTQKETAIGANLYLHVFEWPKNQTITIPGLTNKIRNVYLLSDTKRTPLSVVKDGYSTKIHLPKVAPDSIASVIVLELMDKVKVLESPEFILKTDRNTVKISLKNQLKSEDYTLYYTIDNTTPSQKSKPFTDLVEVVPPAIFKVAAFYKGVKYDHETRIEIPASIGKTSTLKFPPSNLYPTNGANALTDGIFGSKKFDDGKWLGFEGDDLECTIDLGKSIPIQKISLTYLVIPKSWIFAPIKICFEVSMDRKTYKMVDVFTNNPSNWNLPNGIISYEKFFKSINARYVRVTAKNRGLCPVDHIGSGGKSWIFVDEIRIL